MFNPFKKKPAPQQPDPALAQAITLLVAISEGIDRRIAFIDRDEAKALLEALNVKA